MKSIFSTKNLARKLLVAIAAAGLACPVFAQSTGSSISAFSVRAAVSPEFPTLSIGFATGNNGGNYTVRALGPSLSSYGVAKYLPDPSMSLYSNGGLIASNDDTVVSSLGINPLIILDSTIKSTLGQGVYTANIIGKPNTSGVVLGDIYPTNFNGTSKLSGVSALAKAGTGEDTFIAGFVIDGNAKKTVLLRAAGPALGKYGITKTAIDPKIELFEVGGQAPIVANDNWSNQGAMATAVQQRGLLNFTQGSKDAAMLVTLDPGVYTARVSDSAGTGLALFELYDNPVTSFPLTGAHNAVYKHGDYIMFKASGGYVHLDGSKTLLTGGYLLLEIFDEGIKNPLNNNIPVMSLVETQLYVGNVVTSAGLSIPVRIVGFPTTRYYVQDAFGTILYQGEKLPEGTTSTGAPDYKTYWFSSPKDYVQYAAPFTLGTNKVTPYTKQAAVGTAKKLGNTVTTIEATERVNTEIGNFDTYRIRLLESSRDPGSEGTPLWSRTQNVFPDIGIVRFDFFSVTPGDTGAIVMSLSDTNLPYAGGQYFNLSDGNRLIPVAPGQYTKFKRSGYYMSNDGTIEEIGGWFTMEVFDQGVVNPLTGRKVLTLLETHQTDITATDINGKVTKSTKLEAFKRYCTVLETGETAFAGDTGPTGDPVWFSKAFVPLNFPYYIGQAKTETVSASLWVNGQAVPLFSYTPSMKVISTADVRTSLGTFECYRMTYEDTNGYKAEQYTYPKVGVTRFTYPAPAGKLGHMDLTITSTNVNFR